MANPFGRRGWTPDRIPDLTGRTFVITGANSGIGYEASRLLAGRGGRLVWLCRNPDKMAAAAEALRAEHPDVALTTVAMDLSDLDAVRRAAAEVAAAHDRVDALVCNAGIMMIPDRQVTAQGFEKQLGVNHLGHFVLAARLADRVLAAGGRFVVVSSGAHKGGGLDLDDPMFVRRRYGAVRAYCQSKLANVLFVRELERRLQAAGAGAHAYVCHPGYAATNLQRTGPGTLAGAVMGLTNRLVAQSAARGAWPTVLCATDPDARPATYYGPTGFAEARGPVGEGRLSRRALDDEAARRLWTLSEELTGETFLAP